MRRGMVVCGGVNGHTAYQLLHAVGTLPQARYVVYFTTDTTGGKHRYGGRGASADAAYMGMNDSDLPVPLRRAVASSGATAAWLQEPEICHAVDGDHLEGLRLGSGFGGAGFWVFVVCGYLMDHLRWRHRCS